ncbi:MAG: phosphoribosylanthranilate isomerase, partial [Clostridiales bacterium]|nr:phosphoribosylanthranilate isomerase [Clostridiales bacterium]
NEVLPDYIGFVFAESRRKVTFEQAARMKNRLDSRIQAVGVFVNALSEDIISLSKNGLIDLIQLHGDENASYIKKLRNEISNPIIKALRVQSTEQIVNSVSLPCDYLLFDTYRKDAYGGSGECFNWSMIPELNKPYFLAGGLNAQNIKAASRQCPYCLDVSSGVETDGFKDLEKIKEIVNMVRCGS